MHSRIKPEMVGHKVKCQCGFVFRLGAKKDKQPGVAEELKRKRALKQRRSAAASGANPVLKPIEVADETPVQSYDLATGEEFLVQPTGEVEPETDPLKGIPILEPTIPGPLPVADLVGATPADEFADPFLDPLADVQSPNGLAPASAPQSKKKRFKNPPSRLLQKGETRLESMTGPTMSLIVNILSLLAMTGVVWFLTLRLMKLMDLAQSFRLIGALRNSGNLNNFDTLKNWLTFSMVCHGVMAVGAVLLIFAIIASGVTAVMEMSQKRKITLAHQSAAVVATCFLVLILLFLVANVVQLYAVPNGRQFPGLESRVSRNVLIFFVTAIVMGIAPLAVAITGYVRGRK